MALNLLNHHYKYNLIYLFFLVNHLHRTIEITRVNLFNIVTQYKAIFNDDEHSPLMSIKSGLVNQNVIFFSWLNDKVKLLQLILFANNSLFSS